jgi:HK97 family phage major capsid protein
MAVYTDGVFRNGTLGTDTDPLVPEPLYEELIAEATKSSFILQQATPVPMAAGTLRQPVLDTKAVAHWVTGDTGLIESTNAEWKNVDFVAEVLACYVPIPRTYLEDTITDVWGTVRAEVGEAFGRALDGACLFGTDAPGTFGRSVFDVADDVGNIVTTGTNEDLAADIAELGELLESQGYNLNGFASKPGFGWTLRKQRTTDGNRVIEGDFTTQGATASLYGLPLGIVANGSWDSSSATLIAGDWSKAKVAIRRDIEMEMSTQAVIQNGAGEIVFNSFQQHLAVLKVTARYAFATAKPVTALEDSALERAPFAYLAPGT